MTGNYSALNVYLYPLAGLAIYRRLGRGDKVLGNRSCAEEHHNENGPADGHGFSIIQKETL